MKRIAFNFIWREGQWNVFEKETAEKPEKWPANAREQILDELQKYKIKTINEYLKLYKNNKAFSYLTELIDSRWKELLLILYEGKGSEMYYEKETAEKPEKWPANAREQILDTLCECVEKFEKNPSYKTREVYFSLI